MIGANIPPVESPGDYDRAAAEQFIRIIAGDTPVTFQTFDDRERKDSAGRNLPKDRKLSRILHGNLTEHYEVLVQLNKQGAGVFMMINEGDGKGRETSNVTRARAIFVDLDEDGEAKLQTILALLGDARPHIVVQTSTERYHVYWIIEGNITLNDFKPLQEIFIQRFGGDPCVHDLPRVMRIPGFYHQKGEPNQVIIVHQFDSKPFSAATLTDIRNKHTQQRKQINLANTDDERLRQINLDALNGIAVGANPDVVRDSLQHIDATPYNNWIRVGLALKHELGDEGLSIWVAWSSTATSFVEGECESRWPALGNKSHGDIVTLGTIFHLAREGGWRNATINENHTDKGNCYRFVRHFGRNVRYVPELNKWFLWDGTRWLTDELGQILQHAKQTTELMIQDSQTLADDQRQKLIKHALASENIARLKAMIELAKSEPGVATNPSQLDRNKYLLNLQNCTLDLKSGTPRSHNRDDIITRCGNIEYTLGNYECPTWETFLQRVTGGDFNLIRFLQKAFGYSLTADTSEQCLFFLYGMGANGKSTFLNVLEALLHDYSMRIPPEVLMVKTNNGAPTPELARLRGARSVITSEVEEGQRLSEITIKLVTGGERIPVRFLYGQTFEMEIEFKLWIAGNHHPVIRGTDHAIWRRIHLVPFTVTIPAEERDKHLMQKLYRELPGILQWAVIGCQLWQKEGLQPPEIVQAATSKYREDMDTIGQWLAECCDMAADVITPSKVLYPSYSEWCKDNGNFPLSQKRLGMSLGERGLVNRKTPDSAWVGVKLKRPMRPY